MTAKYDNIIVMGKSGAGKQPRIDVLSEAFGLQQLSTGDIFRTYLGNFNELGYTGSLQPFYDSESGSFIDDRTILEHLGIADRQNADELVLGLKAKYYVEQGLFVPDEITNALFESAWRGMGCSGTVLDGYPRTTEQARFLKDLADREHVQLDAILLVENDDKSIIQRTIGRRICNSCGEVFHIEHKPPPDSGDCGRSVSKCNIIQRSDDTEESLITRLQEFRTKTEPAIDYLVDQGIPLYRVPGNLPTFSRATVRASVFSAMRIG